MSTFIFSPGIQVLIDTLGNGIIDISEDITGGSVTLNENSLSRLDLTLLNHRRKYDGVFTPNDIIVLRLKRLNWMPIFTGYLNEVPYFSTYPRAVTIKASCTLKRLKMSVWDEGALASAELLRSASGGDQRDQVDGGLRDKIMAVMEDVAGWPRHQIHIGQIPSDWSDRLEPLREKLAEQLDVSTDYLGLSGVTNGVNATVNGTQQVEGIGEGTGTIPATRGKVGAIASFEPFELTPPERAGPGGVGSANGPVDQWFVQMRFPYRADTALTSLTSEEFLASSVQTSAKQWWKNRKILVVNPTNNKSVVLRAVDWGPAASTGHVAAISKDAMEFLGAKAGTSLEYRFASDNIHTVELGPQPEQKAPFDPNFNGNSQVTQPTYFNNEDGKVWTGWQGLQPYVATARLFVKANWNLIGDIGGAVVRNIAGTKKVSDHATGNAIDVPISKGGTVAKGAQLAMGNAVALWFVANPDVFGTKYVIWNDRANYGNGWRPYKHPGGGSGNTLQHRDHVHVSFVHGARTEAGAMGNPFPGANAIDFNNYVLSGNGASVNQGGPDGSNLTGLVGPNGLPLLNSFNWLPQSSSESQELTGARALMNDTPILGSIKAITNASMRSFMAAPNGDFIAWFPDYFGHYGTASKMLVRDIELAGEGFTIQWDDSNLVTHQFVAGSHTGYTFSGVTGATSNFTDRLNTQGIATVEFTELMEALFNVGEGSSSERKKFFNNPEAILQRFGARVNFAAMSVITGREAEFWYAVHLFQRSWASQFSSRIELSFMPEIYPGMLISLESFKFQAYVETVTHSWSMSDNGGFSTTVGVIAPSTTDRSGFYALPLAGEVQEAPPITFSGGGGGGVLKTL